MTEFTVAVLRNPTEHKIKLQQVLKWSEPTAPREQPDATAHAPVISRILPDS